MSAGSDRADGAFTHPAQLAPRAAVTLALLMARLARKHAPVARVDEALELVARFARGEQVPAQALRTAWGNCLAAGEALQAATQAARAAYAAAEAAQEPSHVALVSRAAEEAAVAAQVVFRSTATDDVAREETSRRVWDAYLRAGQRLLRRHAAGARDSGVELDLLAGDVGGEPDLPADAPGAEDVDP